MSNAQSEFIWSLKLQVRSLTNQVEAFKSGSRYQRMISDIRALERELEQQKKSYENELSHAHAQTVTVRNMWFRVFEDLQKEHKAELTDRDRMIASLQKRILEVERQRDEALTKVTEQRKELYNVKTELEEEKGKNLKLKAQINRDYENSGVPSSMSPNHKKIPNSRKSTERKPGAQPGHKGHPRKRQEPTRTVFLPPPEEIASDPDFKKTEKTIRKQVVNLRCSLEVIEYAADVYRNSSTGERKHALFPDGVINEVTYGGTVRAFLFMLTQDGCMSIDKACGFLSDLTGGKLKVSKGMASKLAKEFADKTEDERKEAFADLLLNPYLHTDFTTARVNGQNKQILVCATADGGTALFFARDHKGHEGLIDTPVEHYQHTLIHDHDKTFYSYGSNHQECLAHILRYLKDSMDNEPERTWNTQMHRLIQEMIHYRKGLGTEDDLDAAKVREFEDRYREVLRKAREEYEYEPPSAYYREGYNLYKRMDEYMSNHLLFLHDKNLPYTNNLSERLLRPVKRMQRQAVTLRSMDNLHYRCQSMGTLVMMRNRQAENLYDSVIEIFDKRTPAALGSTSLIHQGSDDKPTCEQ